jgi:hypothetical protein
MKAFTKKLCLFILALLMFIPGNASAHLPRLVESDSDFVVITDPEISQAFYGELQGKPMEYHIISDREFRLYVGILVPDIPQVRKDISVEIHNMAIESHETIAILDGTTFEWTPYFEKFAKDHYFWGPEYKADDSIKGIKLTGRTVPAGDYSIGVFSPTNQGKYCLVVGDVEDFSLKNSLDLLIIPQIKLHFFNESLTSILLNYFGWGIIFFFYLSAFIVGLLMREFVRIIFKVTPRGLRKNIGLADRLVRAVIGLGLLVWAITTTWNPIIIFLSGFFFFEALFSWSVLYVVLNIVTSEIKLKKYKD